MGFSATGLEAMELSDNFGRTTRLRFIEPPAQSEGRSRRISLRTPEGRGRPRRKDERPFRQRAARGAARRALRPKSLDEVVGQQHLLGPGKPLRLAFESGKPHSMILWGPPGSGKTTLARLMAKAFDAEFIALSAVFSGVKDIREAVQARRGTSSRSSGRHTILFVDEVHRFNKAQQDAFLPYVERGLHHLRRRHDREPVVRGERRACSRAHRCMC